MNKLSQNIILLLLFCFLLLAAGYILFSSLDITIPFSDYALLLLTFFMISAITLFIFFRGQSKEADSQTLHTLSAISIKFLLELVFVAIWFIVTKKTSLPSIIMFFVIYLALTLFSVFIIWKTLKYRSL